MRHSRLVLSLLTTFVVCPLTHAQPTELEIDRSVGPARVWLEGEPGREYTIEGSTDLDSWEFLVTAVRTNGPQPVPWFDAESVQFPQRFYRAVKLDPAPPVPGDDFRLIDHQGKSRALNYYLADTNARAMVLIFTGNGCSNVQQMVTTIKGLTNQFRPPAVRFWMIDANAADNRSNILAEAIALGLSNGPPILHDRAQLVARAYGATKTPEAIALRKNTNENFEVEWSIFYRGAIDDRLGASPVATTQMYLSNALTSFLANGPVAPIRTQPRGCDVTYNAQPAVTYSADIAPLILNKCVRCHSPGNIAPIAFNDYDDVSLNAGQIRVEVLAGRMPPWHADPHYQSFTNDISLTPEEAAKLVQWIDEGAPRGGGPDPLATAPPQTNYPFAWPSSLGTPDIIIPIGSQSIPATGTVPYINVYKPYSGPTVWLRAAVVLPGAVPVVHHIAAGTGIDDVLHSFMSLYVPGVQVGAYPSNTYRLLTSGTTLGFQLHYTASGTATIDSSFLGLYTNAAPVGSPLIQTSVADSSASWSIPPNSNEYQYIKNSPAFSTNVWLYEVYPHMHTRGLVAKYEAIYANGTSEVLLSVPNYEFHWQTVYRFTQPKYLPKGTYIRYTSGWDNSVLNKELMERFADAGDPNYNLYNPGRAVGWGLQTWDEMFIGYYNYSVAP